MERNLGNIKLRIDFVWLFVIRLSIKCCKHTIQNTHCRTTCMSSWKT